jgi:2-polyprenyl-3-methyl-5-hydroxy-6-metoxy-1,4-benzoquinol methylase
VVVNRRGNPEIVGNNGKQALPPPGNGMLRVFFFRKWYHWDMLSDTMCALVASRYPGLREFGRFHLKGRLRRCPYDLIASYLKSFGSLLDIGCGFGHFSWYLMESGIPYRYTGTDIDPFKILAAQSSLVNVSAIAAEKRPRFLLGTPSSLGLDGHYDSITIIDVLYLLPWRMQTELLGWCFSHLANDAGSVVAVKNPDIDAGAIVYKSYIQEWIMVHLLKRTRSSGTVCGGQATERYKQLAHSFGMHMDIIRMSKTGLLFLFSHATIRLSGDNQARQS